MSQTTTFQPIQEPAKNREIKRPSTSCLSDALGRLGFKFQTLDSRIRSITNVALWGPAYTVQCYPGATWAVEEALEKASAGDVLVINGEGFLGAVLMGGLMSTRAHHRALAGAVIDGAVRDVAELKKLNWPVFAAGVTSRGGTMSKLGQVDITISCGGVSVQPGDLIVGDEDGVVSVPSSVLDDALELAWEIEQKEEFLTAALKNGCSLQEAVRQLDLQGSSIHG